ncbi:MAG: hypothetical protein A2046_12435 [Bacteroidetes bacterium GWA2_30_7]|nr:MAG: hypothetical protein A2046_12435 [Bacteroidetes bacterium GWA2_30_7]
MKPKIVYFLKLTLVSALFCCLPRYIFSNQIEKKDSLISNIKNASTANAKITANFDYASFLKYTDTDSALIYVNKSLSIAKKENDERFIMKANNELGIIYWYKGDYKKAQTFLNEAYKAGEKFTDTLVLISARFNIGNINITQGNYEAALENFNDVLNYIGTSDSIRLAQTYNSFGNIYLYQSDYVKALEYYANSVNILERVHSSKDLALSYNNLGIIYYYQEQFEKALELYQKSFKIKESINDKKGMSECYNNIAIIYDEIGKTENAFRFYNKALVLLKELGNQQGLASTYSNLGDLEVKNKNYDKAESLFTTALKIQEEIKDKRGQTYSLIGIGELYYFKKKYTDAIEILKKAIEICQEINDNSNLLSAYEKLKDIYLEQKEYQLATNYYKLITSLQKDMFNEERQEKLTKIQSGYELKEKEKKIALQKVELEKNQLNLEKNEEEKSKQRIIIYSFAGGLIIIIVFSLFLFRLFLQKKKSNVLLARQKQQIQIQNSNLQQANEEINVQKEEIVKQKEIIEDSHKNLKDSIYYAKQIQNAVMPNDLYFNESIQLNLKNSELDYFIFFKPKDIVSGDFYWIASRNNWKLIAVADCTGHGVPGAFMSMLGISFLNEIIARDDINTASQVLNELRSYIIKSLQQKGDIGEQKDGMDMVFIAIDLKTIDYVNNKINIQFAGANNPLYIVKQSYRLEKDNNTKALVSELVEIKGDKMPIAIHHSLNPFTNNVFDISFGDSLYLITDGFADQFGGPKGRKFMYKQMKELFFSNSNKLMVEQKQILDTTFQNWKLNEGIEYEQTDDVTIVGIKF